MSKTSMNRFPLCVTLDGVLIRNDLFIECILLTVKRRPWLLLVLPFWLIRGAAALKDKVARTAVIDPTVLSYRKEVLDVIHGARAEGQPVWLIAESHQKYADAVSRYLDIFERALGPDENNTLDDKLKAEGVVRQSGAVGFKYSESRRNDPPVAHAAATAATLEGQATVDRQGKHLGKRHHGFQKETNGWSPWVWMRAIRIHQWAKNALIFVPLITAHALFDLRLVAVALIAFLSMCLCASATYIVNDLLDLESDRHHTRKRLRPFAAGTLSVASGLLAAAVLMISGGVLAWQLPIMFRVALGAYVIITLLYSFLLKRVASLDVITLAALYTLRVVAGAWAVSIAPSFWLLAFSTFLFLSLALAKRVAELLQLQKSVPDERNSVQYVRGREYGVGDVTILQIMGASSGYIAVLVLALYINSADVARLYSTQEVLWLIAPALLLWITRLWIVTSRGYMNEDPIFFAIRDPETWATGAFTAMVIVVAATMEFSPLDHSDGGSRE